jgi:hypothetical protein
MLRAFTQSIALCSHASAAPWQWLAGGGAAAAARRAASGGAPLQRAAQFAELGPDDVAFFRGLGKRVVVTDPEALEPYNRSVGGTPRGAAAKPA